MCYIYAVLLQLLRQPLTQRGSGVVRCHGTTALMLNSMALLFPVFRQQKKKLSFFSAAFIFLPPFELNHLIEGSDKCQSQHKKRELRVVLRMRSLEEKDLTLSATGAVKSPYSSHYLVSQYSYSVCASCV